MGGRGVRANVKARARPSKRKRQTLPSILIGQKRNGARRVTVCRRFRKCRLCGFGREGPEMGRPEKPNVHREWPPPAAVTPGGCARDGRWHTEIRGSKDCTLVCRRVGLGTWEGRRRDCARGAQRRGHDRTLFGKDRGGRAVRSERLGGITAGRRRRAAGSCRRGATTIPTTTRASRQHDDRENQKPLHDS